MVGEIATECSEGNSASPGLDALEAFSLMNRNQVSRLMVVREGRLEGILSLKDLLKFLSLKIDLEAGEPFETSSPTGT